MDLIERQAAIALADSLKDDLPNDERMADAVMAHNEGILEYQTKLSLLPSAQPELNFDEWCTDCKEYDHERHCCPRFNRVIRNALKDAQLEIVRCKDCKHHHYEKEIPYCDRIDYGYGWKDNDYCSRAERRTDG